MKTKHLILLGLFLFAGRLFAQDFAPIRLGQDFYFGTNKTTDRWDHLMVGYGIDSMVLSEDGFVFHNYPMLVEHPENEGCFERNSWLGQIIQDPEGHFGFENYRGDLLRIEPDTKLGDSWELMALESGHVIQATVIRKTDTLLFGESDQVKIIRLQRLNGQGRLVADPINRVPIHLSKHNGLLHAFQFYTYPAQLEEVRMIGRSGAKEGFGNYLVEDIYGYEVGDEFHYRWTDVQQHKGGAYHVEGWRMTAVFSIEEERTDHQQLITLGAQTEISYRRWETDTMGAIVFDTLVHSNGESKFSYGESQSEVISFFRPGRAYFYGNTCSRNQVMAGWNANTGQWEVQSAPQNIYDAVYERTEQDGCFLPHLEDRQFNTSTTYAKGLGVTSAVGSKIDDCGLSIKTTELVYFHKGEREWGDPVRDQIEEESPYEPPPFLTIYPNPTAGDVYLEGIPAEACCWSLYDLQGKRLQQGDLGPAASQTLSLRVENWGIYLLRFDLVDKQVVKKLLIAPRF